MSQQQKTMPQVAIHQSSSFGICPPPSPTEGQLLLVGEYIQLMLAAILKVSNRQLQDYITGELSEVTPDEIYKTRACAPHNVWTERVLGTYNALYDRAKQATTSLGFGGLITVM